MLLGRLQLTRNTLGISYSPMLNLQRSFAGAPQRKRGQEDDPLPSPSEVYSPGAGTRVSGGSASPLGSQNGQNILSKRLLLLRRVARVNSGGKIRSTSALVVVGNGQGSAGYGLGSSTDVQTAIQKATIQAQKTMAHIPRFDNRTIYSDVDYKVLGTRLMIKTAVPGETSISRLQSVNLTYKYRSRSYGKSTYSRNLSLNGHFRHLRQDLRVKESNECHQNLFPGTSSSKDSKGHCPHSWPKSDRC